MKVIFTAGGKLTNASRAALAERGVHVERHASVEVVEGVAPFAIEPVTFGAAHHNTRNAAQRAQSRAKSARRSARQARLDAFADMLDAGLVEWHGDVLVPTAN